MKKKRASSSIEPILIRFLFRIFRHFSLYFEFRKYLASLSFVSHFIRARLESVQISPYEFSTDARPCSVCGGGREKHGGNSGRSSYALLSEFTLLELACLGWLGALRSRVAFETATLRTFPQTCRCDLRRHTTFTRFNAASVTDLREQTTLSKVADKVGRDHSEN